MRRRLGLLVVALLVVQLAAAGLTGRGPVAPVAAQDLTCADFNNPDAAQALLDADDSFEDALDPDGDGEACTDDDIAELEDAAASEEALLGRFGSPRADLEEEFGEQTNDEDEAWPVGAEYDVEGFRRVSVFYHQDYAAYMILTAERRSPFTQADAEEIAADYLPEDFEQDGQPDETEDGDLLIVGTSEALVQRFGDGTYRDYGASGERGELHFILRFNADNDVSAIEIGLGTEEQTGPEDEDAEGSEGSEESDEPEEEEEPAPDPDEAENDEPEEEEQDEPVAVDADEYVDTVRTEVETLLETIDEFYVLIGSDDFGDEESLDAFALILTSWAGASSVAEGLTPPDGLEDAHDLYLEFAELLLSASTNILLGDDDSIETAAQNVADAQSTGQTLLTVLEGF